MKHFVLDCGCKFPVHDEEIKPNDGLPSISIDFENLEQTCPLSWELLSSGNTKGVFQLETQLGQSWSKRLEPWNMEELSALISLLRPGCIRAIVDGKSMTQHYIDRKHNREETTYLDPSLQIVLENTHGVLTYQEQSMRIAQELAGFNLQEADILRKAIGKKKSEIMTQCENDFLDGCRTVGVVDEEKAKTIFGWIRESQRYAFNKSHGYGYGTMGYWSVYAKAHFPMHFFCSWLHFSHEKPEQQLEVQELVSDAKLFDIPVSGPTLRQIKEGDGSFSMSSRGLAFGLRDIKRIGQRHVKKFLDKVVEYETKLGLPIHKWLWEDFLIYFSHETTTTVVNNLVLVGGLDCYGKSRKRMIYEYETWKSLTVKEQEGATKIWSSVRTNCPSLEYVLDILRNTPRKEGGPANVKRVKIVGDLVNTLKNPVQNLEDDPGWIAKNERDLLGVSLTYTALDACQNVWGNTTCREFLDGKTEGMMLGVEILGIRDYIIKNGNQRGAVMAFISVEDGTGSMDNVIAFPGTYSQYKHVLYLGNTVLLTGKRSDKGDSFIVEKVEQLT